MKLTKRIMAMFMAMLMLFSGMAISAFATDLYTLTESNCYIDRETIEIFVKAATVAYEGENYNIVFTATQSDDETKTLRGLKDDDGNTIFTSPATGKTYNVKGTITVGEESIAATNIFPVKVLKSQNAPAAPVPKNRTSTSIEIATVSGCEYRIDGGAWGSKTLFDGLEPGTAYTIEMRAKENSSSFASAPSQIIITTLKLAQKGIADEPVFVDKTKNSITVMEVEGVEFSIDNGAKWQESGLFTGLSADKIYSVIARYTFDKTEYEPNPASLPLEIKTNSRDSYPAELKNCKFSAPEGKNYANQPIEITVTADTPAKYHDTQFGDTKYVPAYFTVGTSTTPINFTSSDGKVYKATFTPGDENANKEKLAINVHYEKKKCIGENPETKEAEWIVVGEKEIKTYYINVGESYTFFTQIKNFFLEIFNVLFNTLPAKINDLIKGVDLSGIFEGLADLTDMLGGLTGEGGGDDLLGGLLGGATA